jgi:hypothetical protein
LKQKFQRQNVNCCESNNRISKENLTYLTTSSKNISSKYDKRKTRKMGAKTGAQIGRQ